MGWVQHLVQGEAFLEGARAVDRQGTLSWVIMVGFEAYLEGPLSPP